MCNSQILVTTQILIYHIILVVNFKKGATTENQGSAVKYMG